MCVCTYGSWNEFAEKSFFSFLYYLIHTFLQQTLLKWTISYSLWVCPSVCLSSYYLRKVRAPRCIRSAVCAGIKETDWQPTHILLTFHFRSRGTWKIMNVYELGCQLWELWQSVLIPCIFIRHYSMGLLRDFYHVLSAILSLFTILLRKKRRLLLLVEIYRFYNNNEGKK